VKKKTEYASLMCMLNSYLILNLFFIINILHIIAIHSNIIGIIGIKQTEISNKRKLQINVLRRKVVKTVVRKGVIKNSLTVGLCVC